MYEFASKEAFGNGEWLGTRMREKDAALAEQIQILFAIFSP
jgi:hypothetical protein